MTDETRPSADEDEAAAKPAALVTYVVQRQRGVSRWMTDDTDAMQADGWQDIATVQVPPRTKRRTVIEQALAQAGIKPGDTPERLRALDVDSAEALTFEPHQPDPTWRAA
jgi:hypothetical protein